MTRHMLEVRSEDCEAGTCVYTLAGDLMGTADGYAFQNRVREKIASGRTKVILDLGGIERIDSSGIGILVTIMYSAHKAEGRMVLASLPPLVAKVLGIVFLLDHMEHAETVEEARKRLEGM